MKKIAVIGSGISGVVCAYYLKQMGFDISLFESQSYFGGHTNTVDVEIKGETHPVDTGFLVHNDRTYPNLIKFFDELNIETHPSEMSFSVKNLACNITWAGTSFLTLFAQLKNFFSLRFWKFLFEIVRFNKNSSEYIKECQNDLTLSLGDLLRQKKYSADFANWYLLPMGGCIWSTPIKKMLDFPAYTFLVFCTNHGLLQITNRPQWKSIKNGCKTYVKKALKSVDNKFLNEAVLEVSKEGEGVKVKTKLRDEVFDYCIFASHAPDSLKLIKKVNPQVEEVLSAFTYQDNIAVLHTDTSILPSKKSVWAAWNYLSGKNAKDEDAVSVTYYINILQDLRCDESILVTLNPVSKIKKEKIIKEIKYKHPVFDASAIRAQSKVDSIQGIDSMFFCGAWQRYGFHEDGILSAKKVVNHIAKINKNDLIDIL